MITARFFASFFFGLKGFIYSKGARGPHRTTPEGGGGWGWKGLAIASGLFFGGGKRGGPGTSGKREGGGAAAAGSDHWPGPPKAHCQRPSKPLPLRQYI
jgi:hypothetical protein